MTAFEDALSITVADPDHSTDEIRIICTRLATRRERREYEEDV